MISYNIIYSILVLLLTSVVCNAVEPCAEYAGDVTPISQFGVEVQVTSPQHPINYTTDVECYFAQVGEGFDEPFVFSIVQEVNECPIPCTVVGSDNSQIPNQYETCNRKGKMFINKMFILKRQPVRLETLRFILPAGSISSFTFTVTAYPLLSMEPTNSTVDLTTSPTVFITSHQGFPESFYSNNLHNKLTLTDIPTGYDVVIEFIYMNLGTWGWCRTGSGVNDVFRVYRDEEIYSVYECADDVGTSTPDPQQISSANSIRLEFITNSQGVYNGFLIQAYRFPSNSSTSTVTTLYGISIDGTVGAGISISTPRTNRTTSITSTTSTASTVSTASTASTTSTTTNTGTTSTTNTTSTPSTTSTSSTINTANSTRSSDFEVNSSATDSTSESSDTSSSFSSSPSATSYYSASVTDTQTNAMTDNTVPEKEVMISAIVAGSGGFLLLVIIAVLAFKLARHPSNRKNPDETVEGDQEVGDIHVRSKETAPSATADTTMIDSRPDMAMTSGYSDVELCYTTADIRYPAAVKLAEGVESKTTAVEGEVTYAAIQKSNGNTSKEETAADEGPVYADINKGQPIKKEVVPNDAVYAAIGEANRKRGIDEEKEGAATADEIEMIENDLYDTY